MRNVALTNVEPIEYSRRYSLKGQATFFPSECNKCYTVIPKYRKKNYSEIV